MSENSEAYRKRFSPLGGVIEYSAYHRMKADLETRLSHMEAELWDCKKIITELADALQWCWREDAHDESIDLRESMNLAHDKLLQRAREATR